MNFLDDIPALIAEKNAHLAKARIAADQGDHEASQEHQRLAGIVQDDIVRAREAQR